MEQKTQKLIDEVLEKIGIEKENVSYSFNEPDQTLWCLIKTKEPNLFIGKNGEVLRALNHVARRVAEKSFFEQGAASSLPENRPISLVIDVNNYQKDKIENLKTSAHMLSERVKFFKSDLETGPLSAADRRVIHEFLAAKPEIKTESIGLDPNRRVIIRYAAEKI